MADDKHTEPELDLICTECDDDVGEQLVFRSWYKEPRVVLLAAATILTVAGFLFSLTGLTKIIINFIFGTAIVTGVIYPARAAWASIKKITLTINTLLLAATAGALLLNLWEEAAVLVIVFSLGGVLETFAVDRARNSLKTLVGLVPREAHVVRDGVESMVPVEDIAIGEFIHIRPGERVSLDGEVAAGVSNIDQSTITGESIPVFKKPGDPVFAGTINQKGALEVRVTRLSVDTTLAKIIQSVEEHQDKKSTYQRFGERFGQVYTPSMFALALAVMFIPPVLFNSPFHEWFYRGLVVLVVSCSCGIALSVPVAIVSTIANAARHGVLFKGGIYIELLSGVKAVIFDKTGTLTYGEPVVTDVVPLRRLNEKQLLQIAAGIERRSEHPLADAIVKAARVLNLDELEPTEFRAIPGLGARAVIGGQVYHIGNRKLIEAHGISFEPALARFSALEQQGKTLVCLSENDNLIGLIAVADTARESAGVVVRDLKKVGLKHIVMLTGDNEATAGAIATAAGINDYRASLLPTDKADIVMEIEKQYGRAAMVGDGVNDAPALATASVGIAMGAAGSDIAVETSDVALMSDDLRNLPYIFALAKRCAATIRFNIAASLTLVVSLVTLALLGRVDLVPGLLVNELGAFIIILNGLRLLR